MPTDLEMEAIGRAAGDLPEPDAIPVRPDGRSFRPPLPAPLSPVFHGLRTAGSALWAIPADIGFGLADISQGRLPTLENLRSALTSPGPTPAEREVAAYGGPLADLFTGVGHTVKSVPMLAAGEVARRFTGLPAEVVYPALFGAEAYDETKSGLEAAKAAGVGALFPFLGRFVKPIAGRIIGRLGLTSSPEAQKAVEMAVDQALQQSSSHVLNLPVYLDPEKSDEEKKSLFIQTTGNQAAFAIPRLVGYGRGMPSEYERAIRQEVARLGDYFSAREFRDFTTAIRAGGTPEDRTAAAIRAGLIRARPDREMTVEQRQAEEKAAAEAERADIERAFSEAISDPNARFRPPIPESIKAPVIGRAAGTTPARRLAAQFAQEEAGTPIGISGQPTAAPAEPTPSGITFKTSQGSEYTLDENNNAVRFKRSPGTGQGTTRPKTPTLFVSPEEADILLEGQSPGMGLALVQDNPDGTQSMVHPIPGTDLSKVPNLVIVVVDLANKRFVATVRPIHQPEVGKHPFQIREEPSGRTVTHIGNEITEVGGSSAIHIETEWPVRPVQQPGGTTEGAGKVPTDVGVTETGARGGGVAGAATGAEVKAAAPQAGARVAKLPQAAVGDIVDLYGHIGELARDEEGRLVVRTQDGIVEVPAEDAVKLRLAVTPDGRIIRNGVLYEPAVGGGKSWRNAYNQRTGRLKIREVGGNKGVVYLIGPSADYIVSKLNLQEPAKPPSKRVRMEPITKEEAEADLYGPARENVDTPVDEYILNAGLVREKAAADAVEARNKAELAALEEQERIDLKAATMTLRNNVAADLPEFSLERYRRKGGPPHTGEINPSQVIYRNKGPAAAYIEIRAKRKSLLRPGEWIQIGHYSYRVPLSALPQGSWSKTKEGIQFDKRALLAFLNNSDRRFANRNQSNRGEYFVPKDIDRIVGATGKIGRPDEGKSPAAGETQSSLDQPVGEGGKLGDILEVAHPSGEEIRRPIVGEVRQALDGLRDRNVDLFRKLIDRRYDELDETFWNDVKIEFMQMDLFRALPNSVDVTRAADLMVSLFQQMKESGRLDAQAIIQDGGGGGSLYNPDNWEIRRVPGNDPEWLLTTFPIKGEGAEFGFNTAAEANEARRMEARAYRQNQDLRDLNDVSGHPSNPANWTIEFTGNKEPWAATGRAWHIVTTDPPQMEGILIAQLPKISPLKYVYQSFKTEQEAKNALRGLRANFTKWREEQRGTLGEGERFARRSKRISTDQLEIEAESLRAVVSSFLKRQMAIERRGLEEPAEVEMNARMLAQYRAELAAVTREIERRKGGRGPQAAIGEEPPDFPVPSPDTLRDDYVPPDLLRDGAFGFQGTATEYYQKMSPGAGEEYLVGLIDEYLGQQPELKAAFLAGLSGPLRPPRPATREDAHNLAGLIASAARFLALTEEQKQIHPVAYQPEYINAARGAIKRNPEILEVAKRLNELVTPEQRRNAFAIGKLIELGIDGRDAANFIADPGLWPEIRRQVYDADPGLANWIEQTIHKSYKGPEVVAAIGGPDIPRRTLPPREDMEAASLQEARRLIDDPNNGLSEETRAALRDMLDSPIVGYGLQAGLRIQDSIRGGRFVAAYSPAERLIEISRRATGPEAASEFLHVFWELVKDTDRRNVKQWRDDAIRAAMRTASGKDLADLQRLQGEMSSDAFVDSGINPKYYALRSAEEYFVETMTDRWQKDRLGIWGQAKEILASQDAFLSKIRQILQVIFDSLRRRIPALRAPIEHLQQTILSGKYDVLPPSENVQGVRLVTKNAVITAPGVRPRAAITAFHGTPHTVDRFTTERIGSGEGAQVYGWGLYFAENRAVAEDYARRLGGGTEITIDGARRPDLIAVPGPEANPEAYAAWTTVTMGGRVEDAIRDLRNAATADWRTEEERQGFRDAAAAAEKWIGKKISTTLKQGRGYTVRLDVEPTDLLDWDKPLNQQSPEIKAKLEKLAIDIGMPVGPDGVNGISRTSISGQEFYDTLSRRFGREQSFSGGSTRWSGYVDDPKAASELLLSIGIPGIKYLDQGSRDLIVSESPPAVSHLPIAGWWVSDRNSSRAIHDKPFPTQAEAEAFASKNRTYNFVIFDESKIHITHENGQEVPLRQAMGEPREPQAALESEKAIEKYIEPLEETETPERFRRIASVVNTGMISRAAGDRYFALPMNVAFELKDVFGGRIGTQQPDTPRFRDVMRDPNLTPEEKSDLSRYGLIEWQGYHEDRRKVIAEQDDAARKMDELTRQAIEAIPPTNEAELRASISLGTVLDRIKAERDEAAQGAQTNERIREGIDHLDALNDLLGQPLAMARALRGIAEITGRRALLTERPGEEVLNLISERAGYPTAETPTPHTPTQWVRGLAHHLDQMRDPDGDRRVNASEDVIEATLWMLRQRGDWKQELLEAQMTEDGTLRRFNADYINDLRSKVPTGFESVLNRYAKNKAEADALRSAANRLNRRIIHWEEKKNNLDRAVAFIRQHDADPDFIDFGKAVMETTGAISGVEQTENGYTVTFKHPLSGNDVTLDFGFNKAGSKENIQKVIELAEAGLQYAARPDAEPTKAAYWKDFNERVRHELPALDPDYARLVDPLFDPLNILTGGVSRLLAHSKFGLIVESTMSRLPGILPQQVSRAWEAFGIALKTKNAFDKDHGQRVLNANEFAWLSHKKIPGDRVTTIRKWRDEIAGPIIDKRQHFGQNQYRVGQRIAGFGHIITPEDMKAIEAQYKYDQFLVRLAFKSGYIPAVSEAPGRIKDDPRKVLRFALSQGPGTVTRYIPSSARRLPTEWAAAVEKTDGVDTFLQSSDNFVRVVLGHVLEDERLYFDKYPEAAKGKYAQDYKAIRADREDLERSGRMPNNLNDLSQMIADLHNRHLAEGEEASTFADVRKKLIEEISDYMEEIGKDNAAKEQIKARIDIISHENEYTQPRKTKIAPGTLYRYGITDKIDMIGKGNDAVEFYIVRARDLLRKTQDALLDEKRKVVDTLNKEYGGEGWKARQEFRKGIIAGDDPRLQKHQMTVREIDSNIDRVGKLLQSANDIIRRREEFYGDDIANRLFSPWMNSAVGSVLLSPRAWLTNLGSGDAMWMLKAAEIRRGGWLGMPTTVIKDHLVGYMKSVVRARTPKNAKERAYKKLLEDNPALYEGVAEQLTGILEYIQDREALKRTGVIDSHSYKDAFGYDTDQPMGEIIKSVVNALMEMKAEPNLSARKEIFNAIGMVPRGFNLALARKIGMRNVDNFINARSIVFAGALADTLRTQAIKSFDGRLEHDPAFRQIYEQYGDDFNRFYLQLARGAQKGALLTPAELTGRWTPISALTISKAAVQLRRQFSRNNDPIDWIMLKYWWNKRAANGDRNAPFMNQQQRLALHFALAEDVNMATPSSRPPYFMGSKDRQMFGVLSQWWLWNLSRLQDIFSKVKGQKTGGARYLPGALGFLLATAAAGLVYTSTGQKLNELAFNAVGNQPNIWDAETDEDKLRIITSLAANYWGMVGSVYKMFTDTPGKLGYRNPIFYLNMANDIASMAMKTFSSGDFEGPMLDLLARYVPPLRAIINRLPSRQGLMEVRDAANLLRAATPESLEAKRRQPASGADIRATPMTPLYNAILNAAAVGDWAAADESFEKAVELARASGLANPEQSIVSAIRSRSPETAVFTRALTPEERDLVYSRLNPANLEKVDRANRVFEEIASRYGRAGGGVGGAAGGARAAGIAPRAALGGFVAGARVGLSAGRNLSLAPRAVRTGFRTRSLQRGLRTRSLLRGIRPPRVGGRLRRLAI